MSMAIATDRQEAPEQKEETLCVSYSMLSVSISVRVVECVLQWRVMYSVSCVHQFVFYGLKKAL
jgi:hypothetical protein